jgi:nucleoside-diphosphate-sugar epimerase
MSITGAAGHISKPLAEKLLKAGNDVTVIGRNAENNQVINRYGCKSCYWISARC